METEIQTLINQLSPLLSIDSNNINALINDDNSVETAIFDGRGTYQLIWDFGSRDLPKRIDNDPPLFLHLSLIK